MSHPPKNNESLDLHNAVRYGEKETLKSLLESGRDPNERDEAGDTPLHYAAFLTQHEETDILLAHGANPNKTNLNAHPPLALAAIRGDATLCYTLLRAMNAHAKTKKEEEFVSRWSNTTGNNPLEGENHPMAKTATATLIKAKTKIISNVLKKAPKGPSQEANLEL